MGRSLRLILLLLPNLIPLGCAGGRPTVSGDFGTVVQPDRDEVAHIRLRSGEELVARKVQEEDDSLFTVLSDYTPRALPKDSVERIEIRPRTSEEELRKGRPLTDEEKAALAVTGMGWGMTFLILLPALVGMGLLLAVAGAL